MTNALINFNTCIGPDAGKNLKIGNNNIWIGPNAGSNLTVCSNRLIINIPDFMKVDIEMQEQDAIELATAFSRVLSKAKLVNGVLTNPPVNNTKE